ncbi:MAG: hypothetical protein AAFQ51_18280, partial [Pseudomonadota bacterium]
VRKCDWWPIFYRSVFDSTAITSVDIGATPRFEADAARLDLSGPVLLPPLFNCEPVCRGRVEIYRRRCCRKFKLVPSDILDLAERLKEMLARKPRIPEFPPIPDPVPGPDPLPFTIHEAGIFRDGAIDEAAQFAEVDLKAIQSLEFEQAQAYILERPRLGWFVDECGPAAQVGSAVIGAEGEFSVCIEEFPILLGPNCRLEYAFRVIQRIEGADVTIFDGVAANQWHTGTDEITLTSYHPQAKSCEELPPDADHDLPDVYLQGVDRTEGWHLIRSAQTASDAVSTPTDTIGLVFETGSPDKPAGANDEANWGGTLNIRYFFPDALKATGARYYRIKVHRAGPTGAPLPHSSPYLSTPLAWRYSTLADEELVEALNHPSDPTYYRIPYDADREWDPAQYHLVLNTAAANSRYGTYGKHLITLELHGEDASGNPGPRLVPTGSGDQATGDAESAFTYQWRMRPGTTRPDVPWAALTHMFWWDNRPVQAEINAITTSASGTSDLECQFLSGPEEARFGVMMRAVHPEERFLRAWALSYGRGLSNTTRLIESGTSNVGQSQPNGALIPTDTLVMPSTAPTFGEMLGAGLAPADAPDRCAFT